MVILIDLDYKEKWLNWEYLQNWWIKACVQHFKCKVRINREMFEDFSMDTDLRQRDVLSPILFNIVL